VADDDLSVLAERPGLAGGDDRLAVFEPAPGGWPAREARQVIPTRAAGGFHAAFISPAGVSQYTQYASMVGEARRVARPGPVQTAGPGPVSKSVGSPEYAEIKTRRRVT
jgi:hypothetical protein